MKTQRTFLLKFFALSLTGCLTAVLAPGSTAWAHSHPPLSTVRVSVSSTGAEGNGSSGDGALAAYGRFVVFTSSASNLVTGDNNGVDDIFVRDLKTRRTTRVSVSSAGIEGNGESRTPFISDNGRYVAFQSDASNLVRGDDNGVADFFVRDLQTGVTRRFCDYEGCDNSWFYYELHGLSGNGRFIMYTFSPSDYGFVNVGDLKTGVINATGGLETYLAFAPPSISSDGRFIVYLDDAYHDCLINGEGNPRLSVVVENIKTGVRHCLEGGDYTQFGGYSSLSANARFVAYNKQELGKQDVRLIVRNTNFNGSTKPLSFTIKGYDPDLSADGSFVAFTSDASNLAARDKNGTSDVFVRDLKAGVTRRMSVNSAGKEGNKASNGASISANGRLVAFTSDASNLVKGDTNSKRDVFVRFWRH